MALRTHIAVAHFHPGHMQSRNGREAHDRAMFWRIAIPTSLLFWAAVAYGIHSAF